MKRSIIYLAAAALVATSCSQNDEPEVTGYGTISLALTANKEIQVSTKAAEAIPEEELKAYRITVKQDTRTLLDGIKYELMGETEFVYPAGDNYTVYAESNTVTDAYSTADAEGQKWGEARYGGTSALFSIATGVESQVAVNCSMLNAKVTVNYAGNFTAVFENYQVEVYSDADESRKLKFGTTANETAPVAYFEGNGTQTLHYTVKGDFKSAGAGSSTTPKEFTGTLNAKLDKAKWYKLNVTTTNGDISLSFTVDKAVTEVPEDITVNPYQDTNTNE